VVVATTNMKGWLLFPRQPAGEITKILLSPVFHQVVAAVGLFLTGSVLTLAGSDLIFSSS